MVSPWNLHRIVPKRGQIEVVQQDIRPLVVTLYISWFICFAGLALVTL